MLIPSNYVENEKSRIFCLKDYSNLKVAKLLSAVETRFGVQVRGQWGAGDGTDGRNG